LKSIPISLINQLKQDNDEIQENLLKKGYIFSNLPEKTDAIKISGEAYALAYPIQGVLKYHGFFGDINDRIAYFPSISFNNNCAYTTTYLKFDKDLKEDQAILNGNRVPNSQLDRIKLALDFIRGYSKFKTKATLISQNSLSSSDSKETGKGLGTSASGSAALAQAACSIIYDNNPEYMQNKRLISIFSRYLSGSGCRSAVGGFSLWLSHPEIDPLNSYAVRLDREEHQSFVNNISLLTIPINSDLKTHQAHKIAPKSPFFPTWLTKRKELIMEFLEALDDHNLKRIGELAEYDTLCLHAITMTASQHHKIIAWEPDTLKIMHTIEELRKSDYTVYYTIDTGPTLVLLTSKKEKDSILRELRPLTQDYEIIEGDIGGPSKTLDLKSPELKKLEKELNKFL